MLDGAIEDIEQNYPAIVAGVATLSLQIGTKPLFYCL